MSGMAVSIGLVAYLISLGEGSAGPKSVTGVEWPLLGYDKSALTPAQVMTST